MAQFEEDLFLEKESLKGSSFNPFCFKFPNELRIEFDSFGSSSVIHSPVESTASSSETESSDEEFLAALTQRLAQSALYETKKSAIPYPTQNERENWFSSGSPQPNFAGIGRLPGAGKIPGHGSPNGPLQFPSPPETPFGTDFEMYRTHLSSRCRSALACLNDLSSVSYASQHLYQNLHQSTQFHRRPYDHVLKDECSLECRKMQACSVFQHRRQQFAACENGRFEPLQASVRHPWPIKGQGRATFHGRTCANRESVGTGVFLPRNYSNSPEPRKHTGPHAVRPVKFHDTKERSRGPINGGSRRDYNALAALKYELYAQQSQAHGAETAQKKELLLLPMEWTY